MPYKTELTEDCMGIVHTGSGVIRGEDMVKAATEARQLVQNTENFQYEFVDLSDATELRMTEQDLQEIVAQDHLAAVSRPDAVIVVVAPQEEHFQLFTKWERKVQDLGWRTYISRDRASALQWLRKNYPAPPAGS